VAIVIGVIIVVLVVMPIWGLVTEIRDNPQTLTKALEKRLQPMQLEKKAVELGVHLLPVVVEEGRALLESSEIEPVVREEINTFVENIRPALVTQAHRIGPKVGEAARAEGIKLEEELRSLFEQKLAADLQVIVEKQRTRIVAETGLSEQQMDDVLKTLREAAEKAAEDYALKIIDTEHVMAINDMLAELPPLERKMSEQELTDDLIEVLLALMKANLPTYEFDN
jgi:hypothetical protein